MERQLSQIKHILNAELIGLWSRYGVTSLKGSCNRSAPAPAPVCVFRFTLLAHKRKTTLCSRHSKYDAKFTVTSFKYIFFYITKVWAQDILIENIHKQYLEKSLMLYWNTNISLLTCVLHVMEWY